VLVLVLIPLLIEGAGVLWPAIQGIGLSFLHWNGYSEAAPAGFDNYIDLWSDKVFLGALRNTAVWTALFGGISFVGGLLMALALQSERRGVGVYRTAIFLPIVFSLVVTALIWTTFFQPSGVFDQLLESVGLGSMRRVWLGDPDTALYAVIVAALWRQIGYVMVLFIAGLKAVDPAVLEAARVDGATSLQRFWYVTLPQLRPVSLVVVSTIVIDSLRSFDVVFAMTRGGPFHSTELLSTYMFTTAITSRQLGYGSAIAVVIFLLAIAVIISYLVRALSEEKE
jgi:multiple sugar transport system permease protein/raffinose/stachyose/melibiose transport system permease protein